MDKTSKRPTKIREVRHSKRRSRAKTNLGRNLIKVVGTLIVATILAKAVSKGVRERQRIQLSRDIYEVSTRGGEQKDSPTGFMILLQHLADVYALDQRIMETPVEDEVDTKVQDRDKYKIPYRIGILLEKLEDAKKNSTHPPYVFRTSTDINFLDPRFESLHYAQESTLLSYLAEFITPGGSSIGHGIVYIMLYDDKSRSYQAYSLGAVFQGIRMPDFVAQFTTLAYLVAGQERYLADQLIAATKTHDDKKTDRIKAEITRFSKFYNSEMFMAIRHGYDITLTRDMSLDGLEQLAHKLERTMTELARIGNITPVSFTQSTDSGEIPPGVLEKRSANCIPDCMLICGVPQATRVGDNWVGIRKMSEPQLMILKKLRKDPGAVKAFENLHGDLDSVKAAPDTLYDKAAAAFTTAPGAVKHAVEMVLSTIKVKYTSTAGHDKKSLTCQDFALLFTDAPGELLHLMQDDDEAMT